ncbi:MAG: VacJ family lipoprotein [Rubrivivax sp.]|nr:VacJ family lipoprotein [Rubrivivax sp.]
MRRSACAAALVVAAAWLGGCASAPHAGAATDAPAYGTNPVDPWEAFNRKVFAFNDTLDEAILKPVATAYRDGVPELVRRGVDNFFGNIGDAWSAANHLLQGKLEAGVNMGIRFITNTVWGLGGILDIATEARLERRSEDFGQTLGVWGVKPGPYVVLPLFGPRTVRDTVGLVGDWQIDASQLANTEAGRYATAALGVVNTRTNLLAATALLNQVALDKYSFVRDAYLQRRLNDIHDGAPPLENFDDEPESDAPKK